MRKFGWFLLMKNLAVSMDLLKEAAGFAILNPCSDFITLESIDTPVSSLPPQRRVVTVSFGLNFAIVSFCLLEEVFSVMTLLICGIFS